MKKFKQVALSSICLILSGLTLNGFAGGAPKIDPPFSLSNETDRAIKCSQAGASVIIKPNTQIQMQLKNLDDISCVTEADTSKQAGALTARATTVNGGDQSVLIINPMRQKYDFSKPGVTVRLTIDQSGKLSVN